MENFALKNWIPYRVKLTDEQLSCCWLNTLGKPFSEPFFDETILKFRAVRQNPALNSVSNLAMLIGWGKSLPQVTPDAIIFHISRCGSTLISQMLAESEENIVLAEVPFFDDLLRLPFQSINYNASQAIAMFGDALKF